MLGEVTHLQAISDDLKALTSDPHKLPPASEQVREMPLVPKEINVVLVKESCFHLSVTV